MTSGVQLGREGALELCVDFCCKAEVVALRATAFAGTALRGAVLGLCKQDRIWVSATACINMVMCGRAKAARRWLGSPDAQSLLSRIAVRRYQGMVKPHSACQRQL